MEAQKRIWLPKDETLYLRSREEADDVEYIRADLVPQWQPIETARRDGTHLLLGRRGIVSKCYFDGRAWRYSASKLAITFTPIHWHPLPEPPCD